MPQFRVRVNITETFELVVDAPTAQLANALVEEKRVSDPEGLSEHFFATPDVVYDTDPVPRGDSPVKPSIAFDPETDSAEYLIQHYGDC